MIRRITAIDVVFTVLAGANSLGFAVDCGVPSSGHGRDGLRQLPRAGGFGK